MTTPTTEVEPDIYDEAIAYLTANPSDIGMAWANGGWESNAMARAHSLFLVASPDGNSRDDFDDETYCGCLTQIRQGGGAAVFGYDGKADRYLTDSIRRDSRIPARIPSHMTSREELEAFAERQRELDARFPGRREAWLKRLASV